jgi:hypothetical protein
MNGADSRDNEGFTSGLGALHEELGEELRRLRTADDWRRVLRTAAAFHQYSFRNVVLIAGQRPGSTLLGERDTWRYLGRRVLEDENALRIFAPIFSRSSKAVDEAGVVTRRTDHELATDSETARVRSGRRLVGFRVAHVWDVSQTEGEPLPKLAGPERVVGHVPVGLWEGLATWVEAEGFQLSVQPIWRAGVEGFTAFETRQIVISDSLGDLRAVETLAHQVAHVRMHDPGAVAASGSVMCRGMREVEAESIAFVLLAHYGLEADGETFPYVAGWATAVEGAEPERLVRRTGERVVRMARDLIDLTSERMKLEGRKTPVRHVNLVPEADEPAPGAPGL